MTIENSFQKKSFPTRLKLSESANFNRILIKFKPPNQVAQASWQLLSATQESLVVIQIGNTTGVPFLLFLLLYWHVLSHLILPLETHIIFKSLNEVFKQTIFRNVKRDNSCLVSFAAARAGVTQRFPSPRVGTGSVA